MFFFLRRIRKSLIGTGQVKRYLLYALGEIMLVVLGILIALQIDNWNNGRIERREARKTYHNIRTKISDDKLELMEIVEYNDFLFHRYRRASALIAANDRSRIDSVALGAIQMSLYSDFYRTPNVFESLATSGRLRIMHNDSIISGLQELETTYNHINRLEDIHWEVIIGELSPQLRELINYTNLEVTDPDQLYSVGIQNLLVESIYLTRGKDSMYHHAINEIDRLNRMIETELR